MRRWGWLLKPEYKQALDKLSKQRIEETICEHRGAGELGGKKKAAPAKKSAETMVAALFKKKGLRSTCRGA